MTALEDALQAWQDLIDSMSPPLTYLDYEKSATKVLEDVKKAAHNTTLIAGQIEALAKMVAGLHDDPTTKRLKGPTSGLRRLEAGMIELRMKWYGGSLLMAEMRQDVEDLRPETPDPKTAADVKELFNKAEAIMDHYENIHAKFSGVLRTLGESLSLGYQQVQEETQRKSKAWMQVIGL